MKQGLHIASLLLLLLAPCRLAAQQISSTDTVTVHTMHGTYYSDRFVGRKTSSGEVFTQDRFTAAHKSYKFGTLLLVTNPDNGKQVIVRVNDRCPRPNVVDMTRRAAKRLGISSRRVQVRVLPQRYYPIWEMQDQVEELAFNGLLPDFVNNPEPAKSTSAQTPSDTPSTTKTPVTKHQLYHLQLLPCCNRSEAEQKVRQLPIYHQDNIRYRPCGSSNRCDVLLELEARREHAETVRKQLQHLFPEAVLVECK